MPDVLLLHKTWHGRIKNDGITFEFKSSSVMIYSRWSSIYIQAGFQIHFISLNNYFRPRKYGHKYCKTFPQSNSVKDHCSNFKIAEPILYNLHEMLQYYARYEDIMCFLIRYKHETYLDINCFLFAVYADYVS